MAKCSVFKIVEVVVVVMGYFYRLDLCCFLILIEGVLSNMHMSKGVHHFCNSALRKNLSGDFVLCFDELIISSLFLIFVLSRPAKEWITALKILGDLLQITIGRGEG